MSIRFCKRCGESIDLSPENVAECQAICRAEFGKADGGHPHPRPSV
jgi:hypothetical protein